MSGQNVFRAEVFRQGEDGCHTYRIPSLTVAPDGTLIAVAEARRDRGSDPGGGHIDLCFKLSGDGGRTWSPRAFLDRSEEGWAASNPTAVVDRASGRVIVVFNRWEPGRGGKNSRPGTMDNQLWMRSSDDSGRTWSAATDITAMGRDIEHWGQAVPGPGHGIQASGGRLVIPVNAPCLPPDPAPERTYGLAASATGGPVPARTPSLAPCLPSDPAPERTYGLAASVAGGPVPARTSSLALYSDDRGATWRRGRPIGRFTTESQVVELDDGRLMIDARQKEAVAHRWVAFSDDRGESWSVPRPGQELTQICASVARGPAAAARGPAPIFWSGLKAPAPGSAPDQARRDLVLRVSRDGGSTFPVELEIGPGPAAYSDLAVLPDGSAGILWEGGEEWRYEKIFFTRVFPGALP